MRINQPRICGLALSLMDFYWQERERVMDNWTVWVGGSELNAFYLNYEQATELANDYIRGGYDDVTIEQVSNG
jgi:hypothetical protein